jgi:alkylation response protein AidB-like acyl-CoA dehydrogenase
VIEEPQDVESFRSEVRDWAKCTVPGDWREQQRDASHDEVIRFARWWGRQLRDAGWFAPHWPTRWGGSGLSLVHQVVLAQELARADAPRNGLYQVALYNAGPGILAAGTNEQKARFLPDIVNGTVWCQGFSEPGAGSDLAGLQTRAVLDGDRYVVNGQKVWTSHGAEADWCILLVRTDPTAPKRKGITYLLLDMHAPGVEVRPIRQITGPSEFCETFLTDVLIPVEHRLGAENAGWAVTQNTLSSERGAVLVELAERFMRNGMLALAEAATSAILPDGSPAAADPGVAETIGGHYADTVVLRQLISTMISNMINRGGVGPEASVTKLFYSELLQRLMLDGTRLQGLDGQLERPALQNAGWETGNWPYDYLNAFAWTIGGGTNEIMRNIIAERVLGMPREPEVA